MAYDFTNFLTEQDIPYDILDRYGLTQEMIDDLPQPVMRKLLSGEFTPVLQTSMKDAEGNTTIAFARIRLVRNESYNIDVEFAPMWTEKNLEDFEEQQRQSLLAGEVITSLVSNLGECYVQYDSQLRQTITASSALINHNIEILASSIGLNDITKNMLMSGEVVEITDGKNIISLGIDLTDQTGCRISKGSAQEWKASANLELPSYNFGIYGCWISDEINGALTYVAEEDYTEEVQAEFNRKGQQNAASASMKGIQI